jgi:hypothetical protein
MNPIPTNKNVAVGFGLGTNYSGKIVSQTSSSSSGGA